MTSTTRRLKAELWRRYGSTDHPSEWDGAVHGGGKLSQRFWEYFKAIELLDLTADSVVLDIGGGSPFLGAPFFTSLIAPEVRRVIVIDPSTPPDAALPENVTAVRELATFEALTALFSSEPELTHVSCLSVFEHIEPSVREGITRAVDTGFRGDVFVSTFEYHSRSVFFEYQLTAKTASDLCRPLVRFHLDEFSACPVPAENAYETGWIVRLKRRMPRFGRAVIPLWIPVAVRFVRSHGHERQEAESEQEDDRVRVQRADRAGDREQQIAGCRGPQDRAG